MKTISALTAVSALLLTGTTAWAQPSAMEEAEARCMIQGICTIEAEKKFSIAKIDGKAKQQSAMIAAQPAPAKSWAKAPARPPVRVASNTVRRPQPVADRPRIAMDMRMTFAHNSAELTTEAMSQADMFVRIFKEGPGSGTFLIEGHTDSIGSRPTNLELSRRRAQSVVAYLVQNGVPAARLKAVGYGFDRPRDGRPASDGQNRRVEIVKN